MSIPTDTDDHPGLQEEPARGTDQSEAEADDRIRIDVHIDPEAPKRELEQLRAGLEQHPPRVSPRYFYDRHGSELFERITELQSYYQTRTEFALLERIADRVAQRTGATELIELGSGAATKTRVLLDAFRRAGQLRRYVPLDVSESMIRRTADELAAEYPGLQVHGIVGNFLEDLGGLPTGERSLAIFLGGTIGNLVPGPEGEAARFLKTLSSAMQRDEWLLLGTDLIKDGAVLRAAYNDPEGVTAEFNLNLLRVLNDRFDADFRSDEWRHRAVWNEIEERIEMHLVSDQPCNVRLDAIALDIRFDAGDFLWTEISTKYDRSKAELLLQAGGFELVEWFTDPRDWFGLSLARRA